MRVAADGLRSANLHLRHKLRCKRISLLGLKSPTPFECRAFDLRANRPIQYSYSSSNDSIGTMLISFII